MSHTRTSPVQMGRKLKDESNLAAEMMNDSYTRNDTRHTVMMFTGQPSQLHRDVHICTPNKHADQIGMFVRTKAGTIE